MDNLPARRSAAVRETTGGNHVEIKGPADTDLPALRCMGCALEIVSWREGPLPIPADQQQPVLQTRQPRGILSFPPVADLADGREFPVAEHQR